MDTKQCSKCGKTLPRSEFYAKKTAKDGLKGECKYCSNQYHRQYRREHPEKTNTRSREYFREYYRKNKEKNREKNKEKRREYARNYYRKNKERWSKYNKHKEDPEIANLRNSVWRLEHPEGVRTLSAKRRARKQAASGSFTDGQWTALVSRYSPDGKCPCCGRFQRMTIDHVVPLIDGGTNWPENLQPLCKSCNSRKRTKTIDYRSDNGEFARSLMA